jgi:hypothetical protein
VSSNPEVPASTIVMPPTMPIPVQVHPSGSTPGGGTPKSAPEPGTLLTGLLGSGLAGLAAFRRRRRLAPPLPSPGCT